MLSQRVSSKFTSKNIDRQFVYNIIDKSVDKENIIQKTISDDGDIICELHGSNLSVNLTISDKEISYIMTDNSDNIKDSSTKSYNDNSELESILNTIIGVFNVMKNDETLANVDDNYDEEEVLLEDEDNVSSLDISLDEVKESMTKVADRISSLADNTNDIEMKEVITSLANSAYSLALDIDEAKETYIELQEEEDEEGEDNISEEDENLKLDV